MDYIVISNALSTVEMPYLGGLGLTLILSSFLLKLGVAPYYFWTLDIYSGSSLFLFSYLTLIVKTAVFATFVHLLSFFLVHDYIWQPLLLVTGLGSIILGTFGALLQQRIKRFFAYSSVGHLGFILLVLSQCSDSNLWLNFPYYVIYAISTAIFFSLLIGTKRLNGQEVTYFTELRGIMYSQPVIGVILGCTLLSFAGIPPFTGFFVKYLVLLLSLTTGQYVNVIVILFLLVLTTYNYLRIIKELYFQDAIHRLRLRYTYPIGMMHAVTILFTVGVSPSI
jgi:NADH-quinone oxidoreductase subunit N